MMSNGSMVADRSVRAGWAGKIYITAALVALILLTSWAYRPALDAGFLFDDIQNIVESPALHWTEFSLDNVMLVTNSALLRNRPVANLSFAIDHWAGGLNPRGYHLTNVVVHIAVGGALLWLGWLYASVATPSSRVTKRRSAGILIASLPVAIFLLHPLNTQAVTYVVQRMASLAALFVLLAFASYLVARYKRTSRSRWWYLVAVLAWLLGVASKENALLLLPVIALYELCFFREEWRGRLERFLRVTWSRNWTIATWVMLISVLVVSGTLLAAATDTIGLVADFPGRDFNGIERLLTQCRVQLFYLSQFVWPSPDRLNLDHHFLVSRGLLEPATTLPALFFCCLLLAAAIVVAGRQPRYGFPLLAYVLFHAMESGPIGLEIVYEHRMYLPSAMLVLLAITMLADSKPLPRTAVLSFLGVVSFLFAAWTNERNEVWADPFAFSYDMALKSPNKSRVQHNYAVALDNSGRTEEALAYIRRAVDLDPSVPVQWGLLGKILEKLGQPEESAMAFRKVLELDPDSVRALLGLGRVLEKSSRGDEALELYLEAGVRLARSGRPMEAIPILENAVALASADAKAHNALGNTYMSAGMGDRAVEQYWLALDIDPDMVAVWYNLGTVADSLGRTDDAARAYREFVSRAPDTLQQQVARARSRLDTLGISNRQ